jgi:hypothetical protein
MEGREDGRTEGWKDGRTRGREEGGKYEGEVMEGREERGGGGVKVGKKRREGREEER